MSQSQSGKSSSSSGMHVKEKRLKIRVYTETRVFTGYVYTLGLRLSDVLNKAQSFLTMSDVEISYLSSPEQQPTERPFVAVKKEQIVYVEEA